MLDFLTSSAWVAMPRDEYV